MQSILIIACVALIVGAVAGAGIRYRAAVVEIGSVNASAVPATPDAVRNLKLQNAAMIEEWTSKAAAQGAQIVVFGEDLAGSGWSMPVGAQNMYAEPLPQPGADSLCSDGLKFKMPLASAVACTAKRYNITIATGLGDLGPCVTNLSPFTQKEFPCDQATGLTGFNSIGVFGPEGDLLAKYHKSHLARAWSIEYEQLWAEVSPPEVVTFEAPFGVRFGMFICNDINFGGPTRTLLQEDVRDIIFPTLWINGGPLAPAVGTQDGFSRAHGVNLLAANGNELGLGSSGSGIWPADISAIAPQYYTTSTAVLPGEGWMGIADLVSPNPASNPVPPAVHHPADGIPITANTHVKRFTVITGDSVNLTATADGLVCDLSLKVASGSGSYALFVSAGLTPFGWYSAYCALIPCQHSSQDCGINSFKPFDPLPNGGAVFEDLKITSMSKYSNTFLHTAICDGGLTVRPRSALTLQTHDGGARELRLLGRSCSLMAAWIEGRAQSEDEEPSCPYNKYPCSTSPSESIRKDGAYKYIVGALSGRQDIESYLI